MGENKCSQCIFSTGVDQQDDMPVCNIIEPKELFTFSIPFQMDGDTKVS